MIKILIGGSPCTYWSIAQKNSRETVAEGMGWELFKNYLIAKEKWQPDFFLYENNKSAAQPIKDQISKELGVPLQYINSSLVSAQNRQRFYAHNIPDVPQPEDRGILLKDILETGTSDKEKAYCLKHQAGNERDYFKKHHTQLAFEPVCVNSKSGRKGIDNIRPSLQDRIYDINAKSTAMTTAFNPSIAKPIRIGSIGSGSQGYRIYSPEAKSITLCGQGGGGGVKTELYALPLKIQEATKKGYAEINPGECFDFTQPNSKTRRGRNMANKANCLTKQNEYYQYISTISELPLDQLPFPHDGKNRIYEVKDSHITIKEKRYAIKLLDGYYIIRKLTVTECCRLQTLPDDYCRAVSDAQAYKGLGNGWTAEVIIHILKHLNIPKDEEIVVLSMYDGIATGRYCFEKLGYTNIKYFAYEIDQFAIKVARSNYPDIKELGNAFKVRDADWLNKFDILVNRKPKVGNLDIDLGEVKKHKQLSLF